MKWVFVVIASILVLIISKFYIDSPSVTDKIKSSMEKNMKPPQKKEEKK